MIKLFFAGGLISVLLNVFGCTPEPKGAPLIVETASSSRDCRITVNHQRVTSQQLLQIASHGTHTWGIVRMERDAPYKCVGAVIITLQQAGYTTIRTELSSRSS
jgi:hypothetical protein